MKRIYLKIYLVLLAGSFFVLLTSWLPVPATPPAQSFQLQIQDSTARDTGLRFRYPPLPLYPLGTLAQPRGPYLKYPSNIRTEIEYNPVTRQYEFKQKIGSIALLPPSIASLDEYRTNELNNSVRNYWYQRASNNALSGAGFVPRFSIGGEAFDKVFGSNVINIVPQGSAELIFGFNMSRVDNPTLSEKLRKTPSFNFDEKIQMNVTGSIGDKLQLGVNYNTEATFDFENKTKLEWKGEEDDIIKKVEAGNVTLPLSGSLITGSQSLFGLKTEMQFGKLTVTSVFSQQKGETSVMEVKGGAQLSEYEITADNYEANKHFFISQYFRDHYDEALATLPVINSPINITRIEVWVTNKTNNFENSRNIIAFADLGEPDPQFTNSYWNITPGSRFPANESNNLYQTISDQGSVIRNLSSAANYLNSLLPYGIVNGQDYEKIENARLLTEREYTFNEKLGYISLNYALNADEVLAVAYEYTMNGQVYRVGEFSTGGIAAPQALVVKLLKATNLSPKLPTWRLMMKNIYNIGAYQMNRQDFTLNVLYQDDKTGNALNYIPEGKIANKILLKVLHLDNLNSQLDPSPDGVFDFVEGITVNSSTGRIIFPVVEPFGRYLEKQFGDDPLDKAIAKKYVFKELYDSTQTRARQIAEKNKFRLQGTYKSSSGSEIPLNAMNVPPGSVVVTAGGIKLQENIDYTVDYTLGRVKILNQGLLQSGTPIRVSLENQSMFAIQTKTLIGSHFDYKVSDDLNIGATVLHLTERPLTQKVNIGDEPISNTIWGMNGSWRTRPQLLTTLVDKLPFIQTKEPSSLVVEGEFANLIPGSNRAIGKGGVSYIDDFEGSQTSIELKSYPAWHLASTPQGQPDLFPEGSYINDLRFGMNRAKLAWYVIDPLFLRNTSLTPSHLSSDDKSSHFVREVFEKEIWPNKESPNNIPTNIPVLNLAFYPDEKGPYNYDAFPTNVSAGINRFGRLKDPATRWGGIMREIQTNDFEAANVEYIEFWLMDPFVEWNENNPGGDLFFNLGNVSEDVLRDGRKGFENGLPTPRDPAKGVDTTAWGLVPQAQSLVNAFDNDPASRKAQDIGLDGLNDEKEKDFFFSRDSSYLRQIDQLHALGQLSDSAYQALWNDPSSDDYHYYRGPDYDQERVSILDRYKKYNGLEGNSPTSDQTNLPYPTAESTLPDVEDINRDNTLSDAESYYQYHVELRKDKMVVGENFITDKVTTTVTLENGKRSTINWYQFKVPITDYEKVVGSIQDFKSIRFMRMFVKNFQAPVILRFATLELKRGEWRKYSFPLLEANENLSGGEPTGSLDISAVNIEENSSKTPVNYVLPPGINRVIDPTNPQLRQLNEQAMVLKVSDLADGDARAAFRNVELDIRQYRRIRMEVHGEAIPGYNLKDGDLTVFIRLGTDYKNNYYEYEVPLHVTPPAPPGGYNNDSDRDRLIVWPAENRINIPLDLFTKAKLARNEEMNKPGSGISTLTRFPYTDGKNTVYISGNPNLSNVRIIMIGIRNPADSRNGFENDGMSKSAEVWVNELRLTDFNDQGGWAANARASAKLADLGTVTLAGSTSTPGFGSIEKKVAQRSTEQINSYDLSTNLELGKFFPEKANINIPFFMGYSETFVNPQYNPLDPDILFKIALDAARTRHDRDSIRRLAQDYTRRQSINFTNVRFGKVKAKQKPWSPSNFTLSYSFSEELNRDIRTETDLEKRYLAALNYNYTIRPKNIAPFSKIKFLKSPALSLIRDFNFYYLPSSVSIRTDINRIYGYTKLRNIDHPAFRIDSTVYKDFLWNRYYDVKFDLTRSLKMDFSATNIARIDEPDGAVDRRYRDSYEAWRDSVWQNIRNLGRTTNYHHIINLTYALPLNKIPILNWTSHSIRYGITYGWDAGPITPDTIRLGNIINNSRKIDVSGQYNLNNLYNKVSFLKKLNESGKPPPRGQQAQKKYKTATFEKFIPQLKAGIPRSIFHQMGTEDVKVKVLDKNKQELPIKTEIASRDRIVVSSDSTYESVTVLVEGQVEDKGSPFVIFLQGLGRALLGVKTISLTWSLGEGTTLPGYMPGSDWFGTKSFGGSLAPGIPFILGNQDPNFALEAAQKGWLTSDPRLSQPFLMSRTETFNLRSNVEPVQGMKIDLMANRQFSRNMSVYYGYSEQDGWNFTRGQMITGNFTMSTITWRTAFEPISVKKGYRSDAFDRLRLNTVVISARLSRQREERRNASSPDYSDLGIPDPNQKTGEYYNGYGLTSQEVLIPAFFAAYTGRSPNKVELTPFPSLLSVLPNWRINYEGLSKIAFLQRYFRSINITHSYRSTYNVSAYTNNLLYNPDEADGLSYVMDAQNNFVPRFDVGSVSVNEQLSPLLGIDVTWQTNLTTRFDWKKSRTASLSLANNQVMEMTTGELSIGAGYRFDNVQITITPPGGTQKNLKSDLNLKADFSIRDNKTILRKLVEDRNDITAGQRAIAIKLSADYMLGPNFNLRFFYDRMINRPYVSSSFDTYNTNIGFSLTFSLSPQAAQR
ncbi:MAG: cell surface protein SprA [Bacteroidales bacterium]